MKRRTLNDLSLIIISLIICECYGKKCIAEIEKDLIAAHQLLIKMGFVDTMYQHISYQINENEYVFVDDGTVSIQNNIDLYYKQFYDERNDINLIFHINNADLTYLFVVNQTFLPIDQSYYMIHPICSDKNDKNKCYLLLSETGLIIFGQTIHEAFTLLYFSILSAKAQVLAMLLHGTDNINHILLPPNDVHQMTIDILSISAKNQFNSKGYGILEFEAMKRRYIDHYEKISDNDDDVSFVSLSSSEYKIRNDLKDLYHKMDKWRLTETIYQHISAKIDTESILINKYGLEFGEVTINNLIKIHLNGSNNNRELMNAAGLSLHSAIHSYRNDSYFVIHGHHPAISAISVYKNGILLSLINDNYTKDMLLPITYHDYESVIGSEKESKLLSSLGYISNVMILRNHGYIVIAQTAKQALNRLLYLIKTAQTQIKIMASSSNFDEFQICDS